MMTNNPTILIISNHFNHRVAYAAGLAGYGYPVLEAATLDDAHAHIEAGGEPSTLVIDLKPRSMAVAEITHLLNVRRPNRLIVIYGSDDDYEVAQQLSADVLLPRPANLDDLLAHIA